MKNLIFLIITMLFFSCLNENKTDLVSEEKSAVEEVLIDNSLDSKNEKEVLPQSNILGLKVVSPDDLKVDGAQRYFLNDTLFTGVSRQYDGDKMTFEIQFKNGRKNGVSTFWHDNGQKKSILTFSNGIAKGEFKIWDKSGNLVKEGTN